jgi:TPR repeat protein
LREVIEQYLEPVGFTEEEMKLSPAQLTSLGMDYQRGKKGKPKSKALAMKYYKRAADLGNMVAVYNYGNGLDDGSLGFKDQVGAMKYFKVHFRKVLLLQ